MTNSEDLLTAKDPISIYAWECKKKDEEIKKWMNKYIELSDKYIALTKELKGIKSNLKIVYRKTVK